MVFSMKANGKMVYKMEEALPEEQMEPISKLDSLTEKLKEVVFIYILTVHIMQANLKLEPSMEKESSFTN